MRFKTADDILNQTALEVGLIPVANFVESSEDNAKQMVGLLTSAGQELLELNAWPDLVKEYEIVVASGDTGVYALPEDFNYMIDQTGWDRSNNLPVGGPLSAQDWTYLKGRDLVSHTIYVSFRQFENKLHIFPQPPPVGLRLTFEYSSRYWVASAATLAPTADAISLGSDFVLYPHLLVVKMLKMKWLQAKGFDSSAAAMEFDTLLQGMIGRATGAPVLNASSLYRGINYLSPYYNTPDTGFGGA